MWLHIEGFILGRFVDFYINPRSRVRRWVYLLRMRISHHPEEIPF